MRSKVLILDLSENVLYLILSLLFQFFIGASIWSLCNSIDNIKLEKKLNVSLEIPLEEIVQEESPKEIIKLPDIEEIEIKPVEMLVEEIIPEDPFEQPRVMEEPVIPKEEIKPKKKKEIKKDSPKKIKPVVEEKKDENNIVEKTIEPLPVSKEVSANAYEEKQITKPVTKPVSKPLLTKGQISENSKYLAKVMKIFEKNKVYPSNARVTHTEGKIIVAFCIDKNGKTNSVISKTKNPKVLSMAAEELVRKTTLPKPPSHWDYSAKIELPILYRLR